MLGVQSLGPVAPRRVAESLSDSRSGPLLSPPIAASGSERDAWVTLMGVPGLGPVTFAALLAAFGSARAVLEIAAGPSGAIRLRDGVSEPPLSNDGSPDFVARSGGP
jgi:hypothetical protein